MARPDLARLAATAREVATDWGVTPGEPFPLARFSFVASAGEDTVLKVTPPWDDEADEEADELRLWAGDGAVPLLRHDRERRGLLIGRARPGHDLASLEEDEATAAAVEVGLRLWRPAGAPSRRIADHVARRLERPQDAPGRRLIRTARALFADLEVGAATLVHGDFHHHNVLSSGAGYVAIDPKPMLGEPEYDVASFLWNPIPHRMRLDVTERGLAVFAAAGLDAWRMRAWAVIRGSYLGAQEDEVRVLRALDPHGAPVPGTVGARAWVATSHGYASPVRRYFVTTFGCQMNAHDSERIKGMLESLGLGEAPASEDADVLVFNTCTVREKPDTKLAAYLGDAAARKRREPELVVAVGGCYAEAQRERIFERYPFVDVAFGPGSIPHLGEWIEAGGHAVPRGRFGAHDTFAATLPMHRERRFSAWVQVSMGCNSRCAYCIVPAVRGREQSRRPGEIVAEIETLSRDGVREVTLLGQNVNSWGRDLAPGIRTEFGELLRACDAVEGIDRIRFTSPHPKDFREPVIAAIAGCETVCEHVHLPLQSGSTRILKAMRRTYSREKYLALVERLRTAIPDLALGTDVIVGFPGETEHDFLETLEVVEEVEFDSAFTFVYSPRAGTEAAALPGQVPEQVKRERMERLVEVVQRCAADRNADRVGRVEEVLVEGPSRTDPALLRGRTRRNTTVNFSGTALAGDLVPVRIEDSTSTTLRGREASLVTV